MKQILIYILLLILVFFAGCSKVELINDEDNKTKEYSIVYNSDGYNLETFNISDIKIKCISGDEITYVNVTNDMLNQDYDFSKEGKYRIAIEYDTFCEIITIELKSSVAKTEDNNQTNDYKEVSALYTAFSGAALADRVSIDQIGTTLYVGNTFGLEKDIKYISSDPSVIRINDNNVLICLKKGKSTISVDNTDVKVKLTVEEMELNSNNYYSTFGYLPEMNSNDIKTILHNLIDEHVSGDYKLLKTILPKSDADPNDPTKMILLYTGRSQGGPITSTNGVDDWNREHVWPLSKLGGDTSSNAGHDAHHIRPADVSVNAARGNLEFGVANTVVNDNYAPGSSYCKISSTYFEPRDEVKGDIARMLFYMAVRYEGDVAGEEDLELVYDALSTTTFEFGNLGLLLEWNRLDPVDDFEMNRNNVIYTYQKNRNPFIDYPTLADLIWIGAAK